VNVDNFTTVERADESKEKRKKKIKRRERKNKDALNIAHTDAEKRNKMDDQHDAQMGNCKAKKDDIKTCETDDVHNTNNRLTKEAWKDDGLDQKDVIKSDETPDSAQKKSKRKEKVKMIDCMDKKNVIKSNDKIPDRAEDKCRKKTKKAKHVDDPADVSHNKPDK
jgi:hypothetical protein